MYGERLSKLRKKLDDGNLDGIIVSKPENLFYMSGFTGGEGVIIITRLVASLVTDFRYAEQAAEQAPDYNIIELEPGVSPYEVCAEILESDGAKKVGIESHHLTVKAFEELKQHLKAVQPETTDGMVEKLRVVKEECEIDMIKKAQEITDEAFSHILNYIKPGVSEKDLACELEYFVKKNGAEGMAFDTIVASGPRSSLPHGRASDRRLEVGDFVTVDFGARLSCYCSDMTRTVFLGKPDREQLNIYNIVLEAQKKALSYIKPGIFGKDVDRVARDVIKDRGFGENFGHALGHGVGIEIHEEPRLSSRSETKLEAGMVVTVEPGIYISGYGGVRIEDLVVVTEDGCEDLTKASKDIICI
jgi:Xaa-Pro aminopeptidase